MNPSDIFVSLEAHMQEMGRRQASCCLAVSFQQIVHPVLTEEAEVDEASDSERKPMNMHKNARLTPRGRERIVRQVESGQTLEAVAEAAGV